MKSVSGVRSFIVTVSIIIKQAVEKLLFSLFLSFPWKRESSLFNRFLDTRFRGYDNYCCHIRLFQQPGILLRLNQIPGSNLVNFRDETNRRSITSQLLNWVSGLAMLRLKNWLWRLIPVRIYFPAMSAMWINPRLCRVPD